MSPQSEFKVLDESAKQSMSQSSLDRNVDREKDIVVNGEASPDAGTDETQYPQGLRFILLASASIVAVFLIALDQVGKSSRSANILRTYF